MKKIELIFDRDCPNIDDARVNIKAAIAEVGEEQDWLEWDRAASDCPTYAREYGSPTVLVDEQDISGVAAGDANCCRVYQTGQGQFLTAPTVAMIVGRLAI